MGIIIKSPSEIEHMRQAGHIVGSILKILSSYVKPGITTAELNIIAERETKARNAIPSFKGYRGYPASLCVSINEEVVHGIPGKRVLKEGEIVSLDFGVIYNGWQGDAAVTVGVGNISLKATKLLEATKESLMAGIAAARAGFHIGDISAAIQTHVENKGFMVVKEYVGHGIGKDMHEEPQVPNFGVIGHGPKLCKGMTLALEPMVNVGGWRTKLTSNGWTVVTADSSLSAHFEHTIAITDDEPEILTIGEQ
ncbi:MAG: type I methionyl aminopeptidase [Chloroflexi bacterium]|nr:type I methionyl aminopeptidase [Chloroflexota bacterium]